MSGSSLQEEHNRCHDTAIRAFKTAKKMGGTELSAQFLSKLEDDIVESFESYAKNNNSKNLFKSMRTPAVLVCLVIACYFMQEFFQLLGLDLVASVFSLIITAAIIALLTWTYSRYSGTCREVQQKIDEVVKWSWDNFFSHMVASSVGPTANFTVNRLAEMQNITRKMSDQRTKKRN